MIAASTSQLIVTSAHYTAIAKALVRRILNNELIEVTLVSSLCQCVLFEKSQLQKFHDATFLKSVSP